MTTHPKPKPVPLLVSEVRRIASLLDRVSAALHAGSELSTAGRDILESIALGPATVPDLAERRGVSRQHIQAVVDQLLAAGLVARRDNPVHKRSVFIVATAAGADVLREKTARERPVGRALASAVSEDDALMAAAALVRLRERLEMFAAGGSATGQPAVNAKAQR